MKHIDEATLGVLEFNKVRERLIDRCVSSMGKQYAEKLSPSIDESWIIYNLKKTAEAEGFIIRNGTPPLGNIPDIRGIIKRVEIGAVLGPGELLSVAAILRTAKNLKKYSTESKQSTESDNEGVGWTGVSVISSLINALCYDQKLETDISRCIINEEELADDASSALLSIRRNIRRIQDSIKDKLNDIIRSPKYQKFMQDSIVTMRQDRYVVPIKQEYKAEMPGLIHDISASGATVFVEPMAVVNANNEIRELKGKEQIEIQRILAELTAAAAEIVDGLRINAANLAELDFLFAKGKLSLDMNGTSPLVGKNANIHIKKGRHPLLSKDTAVPVDFWTSEGVNTVIITGPNTGGKTVALKTVGLFTLMGQAGLNVPAASGSTLRIFEKVFADIGDEQSIEQSLSTFSSHMTNIVRVLNEADDSTLALFDEIGAGTDPTEGAALAKSILECLHQTGTYCVATTHYSELKLYALTAKGVENACCEFDVETLRPTYRLLIGIPGRSNAFAISERLGLQSFILSRAREFLTQEDVKFEDVLSSIEKNRSEAEEEKVKAANVRMEIEKLRDELARQKGRLQAEKDAAMKTAKEEARKYLLDAKRDAQEILDNMKLLAANVEDAERADGAWRGELAQLAQLAQLAEKAKSGELTELVKLAQLAEKAKSGELTELVKLAQLTEGYNAKQDVREAEELRRELKKKLDAVEAELTDSVLRRNTPYGEPPKNLKAGDTVMINNLNQRGSVLKPPNKNGDVIIQAGILTVTSHISQLTLVDEQKEQVKKSSLSTVSMSKTLNFRPELDLRGMRLEEAILHVDKYLDDASLTGLSEVTIIHGKGTGALRAGVQKYLTDSKIVKSFRGGAYGEGDSGITVATLKT